MRTHTYRFDLLLVALLALLLIAASGGTAQTQETTLQPAAPSDPDPDPVVVDDIELARQWPAAEMADPVNVEVVGQIGGMVQAVAVEGNYAYIGEGTSLTVLDVTDPANPTIVGRSVPMPGLVQAVQVAGSYAYVAASEGGLRILDISDPATPREVGILDTPSIAFSVAIAGHYAYIASGDGGLRIADISNPAEPAELGFYRWSDWARDVIVVGNYAYVTAGQKGLRVLDISNPSAPAEIGYYYYYPYVFYGLDVVGQYAYIAESERGLRLIDISDPTAPRRVGRLTTYGSAADVVVSGSYAYLVYFASGLHVIDVSDPESPVKVSSCDIPGVGDEVTIAGNDVYVADSGGGLRVVDVADPGSLTVAGVYNPLGYAEDVAVQGNHAYVVDQWGGMRVIDISELAWPQEVGSDPTPGAALALAADGSYAFVTAGSGGLRAVDISTPATPLEVGSVDTPGIARGIALRSDYAYVSLGPDGLCIVDVSVPNAMQVVGTIDTPGYSGGVAVSGDYAYVTDSSEGTRVIDVSVPAEPHEVGFSPTEGYDMDVDVAGDLAYVATGNGLRVVNVADPAAPQQVGFYELPGPAAGLAIIDDYAYVANLDAGLRVVDISDLSALSEDGFYDTADRAESAAVVGEHIYVADYRGGLLILRYTGITPLEATIQTVAANGSSYLETLRVLYGNVATNGDFFAAQASSSQNRDPIADSIAASGGTWAAGFTAEEVGPLVQVALPGIPSRGWEHVLALKASQPGARDAFRNVLRQPVGDGNARLAANEMLSSGHFFHAAQGLRTAADGLQGEGMVDEGWQAVLAGSAPLQNHLYAGQQVSVGSLQADMAATVEQAIASLPALGSEEAQAYQDDLNRRDQAHAALAGAQAAQWRPLQEAGIQWGGRHDDWIARYLARYEVWGPTQFYAGGPGALADSAGSPVEELYHSSRSLDRAGQLLLLAAEGLGGTLEVEKRIYLNTVHGLDNLGLGITPQVPTATLTVTHTSEGVYKTLGRLWWCERAAYSDVRVDNPTTYDTTYQAIATFERTGLVGSMSENLVAEAAKPIPGGGLDTLRLRYKQDPDGTSPDEGGAIEIDLLGSTNTGTYYLAHESSNWTPVRVDVEGGRLSPTQGDTPAVEYPMRSRLALDEKTLTVTPYVWVENPFTQTVLITLTQPLPPDVQLLDSDADIVASDELRWLGTFEPRATQVMTHVVRYLGGAGQEVVVPPPVLEMSDVGGNEVVAFAGNALSFVSLSPLEAEGRPQAVIRSGSTRSIPLTIINRSSATPVVGMVTLRLVELDGTEVYSTTQEVTVPSEGQVIAEVEVDATSLAPGVYVQWAGVTAHGGQDEAFEAYLWVVEEETYLPLVARSQ